MADIVSARGTEFDDDESTKREELFDPAMRYLLLLRSPTGCSIPVTGTLGALTPAPETDAPPTGQESILTAPKKKKKKVEKVDFGPDELVGYCSFRFDTEQTLDDDRLAEVIYW
jgi:hypothetical protein